MEKKTKLKLGAAAGVVGAIVYVLLPTDFVFDVVPVVGWLDDAAAVLAATVNAFHSYSKIKKS